MSELSCGTPPTVKHAEVQFSSTTPGSMAVYICNSGFTSVPRATQSICGIQGDWSQPPICEGLLHTPIHGHTLRTFSSSLKALTSITVGFMLNPLFPIILEVNECLSQPCVNGGTCRNQGSSSLCECVHGFSGNRCQTGTADTSDLLMLNSATRRYLCFISLQK